MEYSIRLNSLYICVRDLERARRFYTELLGITDEPDRPGMFVLGGFRFMLYDYQSVGDTVVFGDNCLPSFLVDDLDAFERKLASLGAPIVFPRTRILGNDVLEFRDPEGNDIEVYARANNAP